MESLALGPLILLGVLGAAAAAAAGRAVARTWRAPATLVFYSLLLACVVEFLAYAMFGADLMSLPGLALAFVWTFVAAWISFQLTRRRQMAVQYGFTALPPA